MKFTTLAAAAVVALAPMAASAVTVTVLNASTNGVGNQAHIFAADYSAFTPAGASWSPGPDPVVAGPPSNLGGVFKSPFANTPLGDDIAPDQSYFSIGGVVDGDPTPAPSPQLLNFSTDQTLFKILWGSIDNYNKISFLDAGGVEIASWTGTQAAGLVDGFLSTTTTANAAGNFDLVGLFKFEFAPDEAFRSVQFRSDSGVMGAASTGTDKPAMEFALVPLPAALLLFGTAFAGAGLVRRYGRKPAAA